MYRHIIIHMSTYENNLFFYLAIKASDVNLEQQQQHHQQPEPAPLGSTQQPPAAANAPLMATPPTGAAATAVPMQPPTTVVKPVPKGPHPISTTPVPSSPWSVVWTSDHKMFFFDVVKRVSLWTMPAELEEHPSIESIVEDPPWGKSGAPQKIDNNLL